MITDVVFAYSTAQNAFCCLVGAILNISCPRERRGFQSKLGVSSSNQCNLHHSPHTGHLEKKIKKKGTIFFGHDILYEALGTSRPMTELHLQENLNFQSLSHYLDLFGEREGRRRHVDMCHCYVQRCDSGSFRERHCAVGSLL